MIFIRLFTQNTKSATTLLFCVIILSSFNTVHAQSTDYRREAQLLVKKISKNHFNSKPLDDTFSRLLIKNLLEQLDPDGLYLTNEDLQPLLRYEQLIDDELWNNQWTFVPTLSSLYKKTLQRSELLVTQLMQNPISWTGRQDSLWIEDQSRSKDIKSNEVYWSRWLRYKTLDRIYTLALQQGVTGSAQTIFNRFEAAARKQVLSSELRHIRKASHGPNGIEGYVAELYLKAIANTFDPHTNYFSPSDMENFVTSISSQGLSFGLGLDENERGEVVIAQLVPGGPAWKTGELNTSDVIIQLKVGDQDVIELYGFDLQDIDDLLEPANHVDVEFTVRKTGGKINTVKLRKEKVDLEENIVRSFILRGDKNIGFISLPGFYTDFESEAGGRKCANDVAREIVKLTREGIDGLILDVRYNGGGSLLEALEMAGIFIDHGALAILKNKAGELNTIKDNNRGTVYDGPLVLMTNRLSASASEFLAAALQDHNRAIIVGSTTYGKATAQQILPLNPATPTLNDALAKPSGYGFVAVTLEKIYRVTGLTAQIRGVTPDIKLPDILEGLDIYESSYPLALLSDTVTKKVYYYPNASLPLQQLRERSAMRVDTSRAFHAIREFTALLMIRESSGVRVPLSWNDFANSKNVKDDYRTMEELTQNSKAPFTVSNHAMDKKRMEVDTFMRELNAYWLENLETDVYLAEAFNIISDYIAIRSKNK